MKSNFLLRRVLWLLIPLLTSSPTKTWASLTADSIVTTAATSLVDGGKYVIGSYANSKFLGATSGTWGSIVTLSSAYIFTVHGSATAFYATCTDGTLQTSNAKSWGGYANTSSNNIQLSASGDMIKYGAAKPYLKINGSSGFRWYDSGQTAVYMYQVGNNIFFTQPNDGSIAATSTASTFNSTLNLMPAVYTGNTVTLTATPPSGYEVSAWTVQKKSDNSDVTTSVLSGSTLTMPAYDVKVSVTWRASASCATPPTVSASSNGSVTCTSATITCNNGSSKGVVKGSCDISEWGFVYGTSGSPTGNKTSVGTNSSTDVANFSHTFTGLTPGQTYYFRAYAIVNGTTYYGSQTNFTCKTITVTANNGSYGSVSGSGLSWTATPNSGYVFADPAYTITAGNNTSVNKVGNTFTITSTSTVNVTITINFEAKNCTEHAGTNVTSGASTSYAYGPVSNYHNYCTRQILYTKTDLNLGTGIKGSIKSIYFEYAYSSAMTKKTNVTIYMANTNLTALAKGSCVPYSEFTQVYTGSLNCSINGWNEIELNTPFEYNGVGSLVVLIDDNSEDYDGGSSTYLFKYHEASTTSGAQIYYNSDTNNDNPSTTDWSTDYTATNYRPNTKFCIEEKPMSQYTVNWYVNGTRVHNQTGYEGTALTNIPTPDENDCDGTKVFVGWYTSSYSDESVAPAFVSPTTIPNGGASYYAVFANASGSALVEHAGPSYSRSSSTDSYTSGYTFSPTNASNNTDNKAESGSAGSTTTLNLYHTSTAIFSSKPASIYVTAKLGGGNGNTDLTYPVYAQLVNSSGAGIGTPVAITSKITTGSGDTYTDVEMSTDNITSAYGIKLYHVKQSGINVKFFSFSFKYYTGGYTYSNFATTCCNQLAAPANPGETPNSTGAVLTWDAVTGATGYEVKIDDGAWTSTGNGTTTGYTIIGKACGGTSISWQVRATGDGSTNCAKGAATTARNFTTTACACTNQYTYFWGTQITNDNPSSSAYASHHFECFNTWNSTEGKTGLITLPNSDTENYWFVGYNGYYYNSNLPSGGRSWCTAIANMNFANSQSDGKVLGWDGGYSYPRGATGYIRIYSDNTNSNKYAAFIPSGYILRWKNNRNSDAWTSYPFTDTGASNYWETDLVQLGADLSSDKVWVGLPTSGMSESFTWCGKSEEKNLIGVGKKTGASTWAANGIVAGDANQWGKWRIEITNNATNWNVHFVPYWKATYDVNGGGAISPTATNEGPVSCEGDATARQVTMPAAPSYAHHVFGGWKSSADNQVYNGGVTVSLSQNTTFTAQWTNSQYNITATLTNVTTETSFPVAYTYTGSAANVTYTFAAASGYRLPDAVTVTGCAYEWDKTTGELTLTGTIEGAVSITISGTRTHTVSWTVGGSSTWTKAAGGTFTGQDPYDDGATLVVAPNPAVPSACDGKVFIGWTTNAEITEETSTQPSLLNTASPGTVTSDGVVYRAVFAEGSGELGKFKRVTSVSDITAGSQIAIAFLVSTDLKLCSLDFNEWTTYSCATTVTETSGKINTPANAGVWNVSKSGDYWVFTNAGDGSTKLATSNSGSNQACDPSTQTYYRWEIGSNSSGTNHFYLRLYDGSAMTNCALELFQSTWKIYAPKSGDDYTYASNAYTALNLYVPDANYDKYITTCSTCATPSGLATSNITSTGAKVTWNGVSSVTEVGGSGTGFTVLWGTDATRTNNSNTANVASGTNEYTLTGLTKATTYYVWVQSKCNDEWSSSTSFTTLDNHTATFIGADGSTLQSGNVDVGAAITYSGSTPVTCDDGDDPSNYFVGWATDTWNDKVAKASIVPTFYDIANGDALPNMGASDITFHAVFAKRSGTPLTNHAWTYTFTAQTFKSNGTKTLAGTDGGDAVNADWELLTYNQSSAAITNWGSYDSDRGSKIGKNDDDYVTYMYLSSESFDGTVTAVKISTSGNSDVTANVSATVGGTTFYNGVNSSLDISSSNAEYSFSGSKAISGDDEILFIWEQESAKALYIKKIEIDYTTGGDVSYSNYMTTCSQCVTPSGLEASSITEAGATITWSGTSNSGTTGFKVLWSTNSSRPEPATGNNGDTNAETKTYSISGLNAGTTYYVWVQSKCDGSWSSSINFTTKAIHAITLTADNGTIAGGSPINVVDGATLTFPNVTGTSCGSFVGWTTGDYDNVAAPATLYANGAEKANITADESYKALYRTASGAETNVTDNWTGTKIGVSIYDDWSGKVDASAAVYAGNSTKNSSYSNCLQLRSTNNSGIITTTSGGKAKKVTVTWNSNTTNDNTLDVYGKNTAYSAVSDLYNNDANVKGTKIGSIVKGTSTELTIDGDYAYIGVRSNSGALYIDNLAIEWYGLPMKYTTAPACDPMVSMTSSFSTFSYVYAAGPSSSQSFTVSGIQLGADLVVTAPANYEVCKTADGTYTSSVSYTPTDGAVAATVYIRLAAGLNVGTYNYVAASGVAVTSTGATTANAALNGSVTKADCAITFTDFNAVDHYEGVLEYGSSVTVSYNYTYPGDGTFSISHSPGTGTINKPNKTLTVSVAGIWTLNASATAGTNYNKPANASAEIRVKCVDTYVDFIHNKTIKAYGSGTTVTDGKMEDWGSGYTVPYIDDNATETSGSCQQTHFKFVGWVSEDDINIADGTFKPGYTLIEAGTTGKRATTKTYYAVWAKQE